MENEKKVTAAKKLRLKDGLHAVVEPEITEFPLEIFIQKFSDATYQLIDWHWHTELETVYIESGTVTVWVGEKQFDLTEYRKHRT